MVNEVRSGRAVAAVTRGLLVAALVVAGLWSAVTAIAAVAALAVGVRDGTVSTTLSTETPVMLGHAGGKVSAVYDSASVVVAGAPAGVQLTALAAQGAAVLARLVLGVAFVLLVAAVLRRSPFSSRTALRITVCGGVAMIGAVLGAGLGVLADWMVADHLNSVGAGSWPIVAAADPGLIPIGFALMVVGLLISHGAQLQRATDGLV